MSLKKLGVGKEERSESRRRDGLRSHFQDPIDRGCMPGLGEWCPSCLEFRNI